MDGKHNMNGILGLFRNPKLALLAIFGAIGLWMLITPMYVYVIELAVLPVWVWMLIGLVILMIVAKYGKMML